MNQLGGTDMKLNSLLQGLLVAVVFSILCLGAPSIVDAKPERKLGIRERRENIREPGEQFDEDAGKVINWRKLNLSPEQKAQVRGLRREFEIATVSLRKELAFAEEELQQEIRRKTIDREKIDRLVREISSLKQRISEAATDNLLGLKAILTQEQREQLAASHQALPGELGVLRLTEDQKMQIRKLLKSSFRQHRKLSNELRELRSELRDLLLSTDEPDSMQLKEVQTQIATKELALERAKIDNRLAIRELLTPEQLKMLK